MQSTAIVALALLESVSAFTAPAAAMRSVSRASATMFSEGDLGVLPPLGVFDPLGLIETRDMRRYEIMEIKHGRAAMLGFLHVIAIEAGVRVPGYLSTSQNLKFSDVPAGCFASLEAVPTAGWLQIMVLTCMQEAGTGFASKPQTDDAEAGDIALDSWVRYDDPEVKAFKLNAERQNGRAAMLGITGCLIHELLRTVVVVLFSSFCIFYSIFHLRRDIVTPLYYFFPRLYSDNVSGYSFLECNRIIFFRF